MTEEVDSESPTPKLPVASTTGVKPHPQTAEFNQAQLDKSATLFVVAFDSVTRQDYFLTTYSTLTPLQTEKVRNLVSTFELNFTRLRDQRTAILENARDGQDVEILLKNNCIEIALLSKRIHSKIFREVLSKEQRHLRMAKYKAKPAAKNVREESQQ